MRAEPVPCLDPASLSERVFAARGWLSRVPAAVRQRILEATEARAFATGEAIVSAGQEGGGPMGLLQGRVGCWGSSPWSGPILGHVAIPGDWFGQGPAQLGIERSMSFRALEASTLLYLPAYRMQQMAAATPELHAQFAKLSETSAQLMVGLIADALTPGAERRLAAALLKAARSELDSGRLAQAPLPLGQASLSELTCVSRAHVNRILRRWTAKGLVKPGYKDIRLLSLEGLRSIARGTDE